MCSSTGYDALHIYFSEMLLSEEEVEAKMSNMDRIKIEALLSLVHWMCATLMKS